MTVSRHNLQIAQAKPEEVKVASSILTEAANWLAETGREMWFLHELTPEKLGNLRVLAKNIGGKKVQQKEGFLAFYPADAVRLFQ